MIGIDPSRHALGHPNQGHFLDACQNASVLTNVGWIAVCHHMSLRNGRHLGLWPRGMHLYRQFRNPAQMLVYRGNFPNRPPRIRNLRVECLSDSGGSLRHLRLSPSVEVWLVVPSFFAVITRPNQLTCLVRCPALELAMDSTPSPVSPRLMRTPQRATLSPKGARARESTLPSPPWGRGAGGEGVRAIQHCQILSGTPP